jgi:hypothetical protein
MAIPTCPRALSRHLKAAQIRAQFNHAVSIACLIWLLLGALCGRATAGLNSDAPRIDLPDNRHDFGDVFKGEAVSHTFQFRNAGSAVLKLSDTPPPQPKKKPASAAALRASGPIQLGLLAQPLAFTFVSDVSNELPEIRPTPVSAAPS